MLPALLGQREGERDARNEQEERENGVVVHKAVPLHVLHLLRQALGERAGEPLGKRSQQARAAHDEEHVKTSERIQRLQPLVREFYFHIIRY